MAYVYILVNKPRNRYYVGCTTNVQKRLQRHYSGYVHSTKRMLPVELAFKQYYQSMSEARIVEKKLKNLKRKDFIEKIIQGGAIRLSSLSSAPTLA